ncbi:MAG: aconitase X catalytic domain-containing protein [Candidatus Aenigmatarchaeota archaeon]
MQLTNEEQEILDGKQGEAKQKAMQLLVALGDIYGARRLIPIKSVQIGGVSYKNIGDAGIDFIKVFAETGAKVSVPTTLNPAGCDIQQWKETGISENFYKKQKEIIDSFTSMGIESTCTCTPYLVGNRPKLGDHVSWAESSAVVFANSVLGARTNREGGPSTIASAIIGKTPEYGYHLDENRKATFLVKVDFDLNDIMDYGLLGAFIGKKIQSAVPAFKLKSKPSEDQLKALGAAMAAWGAVALFYVENSTPEFILSENVEEIIVAEENLEEMRKQITTTNNVQLLTTGCPHASLDELRNISEMLKDKKMEKPFWIYTARKTKETADEKGYVEIIEKSGAKILCDCCPIVSPIEEQFSSTATNSGKCAFYLPGHSKQKVLIQKLSEMIK